MSFELALKEIATSFKTDDGVEMQIRPLKTVTIKGCSVFQEPASTGTDVLQTSSH